WERASNAQTYAAGRLYLDRGDLKQALVTVDSRLPVLSPAETYWYWKLATLKAEILMQQRHIEEALSLLEPELPPQLAGTDVDLRRRMTLGISYAYGLKFDRAERLLSEAETLAAAKYPELLGDVLLRQGTLALTRNRYEIAASRYQDALKEARSRKNP